MRISDWSSDVCSSDLRFARGSGCAMGHRPPPVWQQLPGEGKKTRMKRWLKILGVVTGLAAAAFFIVYAYRTLHGQDLSALLRPQVALALCLLTLLYTALIPVTAVAWSRLPIGRAP